MPVRCGLLGAGEIATTHLDTLAHAPDAEIVGICDRDEAAARRAARTFEATPYADLDELLVAPDVDALFVCVPPDAHGQPERIAAERGIDLFIEKPIARRTAVARAVHEAIEANDVIAAVGHNWRYAGGIERARELLDGRDLGYLDGHVWGGVPRGKGHWWPEEARSGGQPIEQGVHVFDAIRYLAGDVDRVWAAGGESLVDVVDFPDVSSATMEHRSGVISHVSTSCAASETSRGIDVIAEGATFTVDESRLYGTIDGEPHDEFFEADPYEREVLAFLQAASDRDETPIRSTYADALRSLAVTEAATVSMARGEPVRVTDVLG